MVGCFYSKQLLLDKFVFLSCLQSLRSVFSSQLSASLSLHLLTAVSCLSAPLLCLYTASLNYIYSCMPWYTVWIFLFDAVVESHFFYGAFNLYVRGVMMEESCSTTRHWGMKITFVMFASVQVSSCRRQRMTPLLRWRKKHIFDLCDSLFFSLSDLTCDAQEMFVVQWWLQDAGTAAVEGRTNWLQPFLQQCMR